MDGRETEKEMEERSKLKLEVSYDLGPERREKGGKLVLMLGSALTLRCCVLFVKKRDAVFFVLNSILLWCGWVYSDYSGGYSDTMAIHLKES